MTTGLMDNKTRMSISFPNKERLTKKLTQNIYFLQDYAPFHKVRRVQIATNDLDTKGLPHLLYSLFLKTKLAKGNLFHGDEEVIPAWDNWLHSENRVFCS